MCITSLSQRSILSTFCTLVHSYFCSVGLFSQLPHLELSFFSLFNKNLRSSIMRSKVFSRQKLKQQKQLATLSSPRIFSEVCKRNEFKAENDCICFSILRDENLTLEKRAFANSERHMHSFHVILVEEGHIKSAFSESIVSYF